MKLNLTILLIIVSIITYGQGNEDENIPFYKNGKYIFCNHKHKQRIKATFDFAQPFIHNFAIVANDSLFGVINQKGKVIVPIKFKDIKCLASKYMITVDNKDGIYFSVNKDSLTYTTESKIVNLKKVDLHKTENIILKTNKVFKSAEKYGLIYGNDTLIQANYLILIPNDHNGLLIAKTETGFGIVNHKNEIMLPFEYSEIVFDQINSIYLIKKADANNHCYFYHQSDDMNLYCQYKSLKWYYHDYYFVFNHENQSAYFVNFYTGKEFIIK